MAPEAIELDLPNRLGRARPEPISRRPADPRRLVHRFDFEETDDRGYHLGAGYTLPPHWYAIGQDPETADPNFQRQPLHQRLIQRPGFPAYTDVGYQGNHRVSGEYAMGLGLDSGSAGAFLEVGTVPAIAGSDYRVNARVRTEDLRRSGAQIRAYFVDQQGREIEPTATRSDHLRTDGRWTTVSLELTGGADAAAWIGLELTIDQPRRSADSPLGTQQIVRQDISGRAWFDDIEIWQLPHVHIGAQSPVNLIHAPDRPEFDLGVRDLTGQRLAARATVYDHRLRPIARSERAVGAGGPSRWGWSPQLPGFGWYLLELTVYERGAGLDGAFRETPLVQSYGAVAWLPALKPLSTGDGSRFVLDAVGLPDRLRPLLPDLLDGAGLRSITLPAWSRDTTLSNIRADQRELDSLLRRLGRGSRNVSLALSPVPDALAQHPGVDASTTLGALSAAPELWIGYVAPVLSRHGQQVRRWRLGSLDNPGGFYAPDLAQRLADIRERFLRLAPGPVLSVPWRADQARRGPQSAGFDYVLDVPPAVRANRLDEYIEPQGPQAQTQPQRLRLRVPPADELSHDQRVSSLLRRMLHAWELGPVQLSVSNPWTSGSRRAPSALPDPLLPAFTNASRRLAGREVIDRLRLADGLEAMVLDGPAGGMLAAWNNKAHAGERTAEMYLGENPVAIDAWGNREPLKMLGGKHRVALGSTPTFIEGINPKLARFRAAFRLNEPSVESRQTPHRRTLRLTNPWDRTISGKFRITGPDAWTVRPQQQHFSIPAGDSVELPVTLRFPVSEVTGPKKLAARFDFRADKRYRVDLATPMELGLSELEMVASLSMSNGENGGRDARVHTIITNTGEEPRSLYAFASLPGFPREQRPIPRLEPGESIVRTFRFESAGEALRQHPIRCGVRATNGPAMLNQKLTLDQTF